MNKNQILKKFEYLSNKYHKMSLLFYELEQSLKLRSQNMTSKELREYLERMNFDLDKIKEISSDVSHLSMSDFMKDKNKNG